VAAEFRSQVITAMPMPLQDLVLCLAQPRTPPAAGNSLMANLIMPITRLHQKSKLNIITLAIIIKHHYYFYATQFKWQNTEVEFLITHYYSSKIRKIYFDLICFVYLLKSSIRD